jgi:four helix bundle protein
MPRFAAYDLALQAADALRPVLDPINRRDSDLCRQIRRAASSVAMCLDEGSQRAGGDRLHLYRVAAGSAAEVRTALALATTWGYVTSQEADRAHVLFDRVVAILWRLTHPKRCAP